MEHQPSIFSPPDDVAAGVLEALADPDKTLRDVAEAYGVTLAALCTWMQQPDVAAQLDAFDSACIRRARFVACNNLPAAVESVVRILHEYTDDEEHIPVNPKSIADREQRRRSRETARRAASLLLRFTRVSPLGGSAPTKSGRGGLPRDASHHAPSDPFIASTSPNGHAHSAPPTCAAPSSSRCGPPTIPDPADLLLDRLKNAPQPSATIHSPLANGPSLSASMRPRVPASRLTQLFGVLLDSLPHDAPDGALNGSMDLPDPPSSTAPP